MKHRIKEIYLKYKKLNKWLRRLLMLVLLLLLLLAIKKPMLGYLGRRLIHQDPLVKSEAIFVLSGSPLCRASHAAMLYKQQYAPKIVCTGEIVPEDVKILSLNCTESELSARVLQQQQVPDSAIYQLKAGTSTYEEAQDISEYCRKNSLKKIIVVSSSYHTGRVHYIFQKVFRQKKMAVAISIQPAWELELPPERPWWKSEQGLIMINNEYMKKIYYLFKY